MKPKARTSLGGDVKYVALIAALILGTGCSAKAPHKQHLFVFEGVRNGRCEADSKLTHWDANTGALVIVCKPETK